MCIVEFLHHYSECVLLPRFNYDDTCLSEAKPGRVIYSKNEQKVTDTDARSVVRWKKGQTLRLRLAKDGHLSRYTHLSHTDDPTYHGDTHSRKLRTYIN